MEIQDCVNILNKSISIAYEVNGQNKENVDYKLFNALEIIGMNGANSKKKSDLDTCIINQLFLMTFSGVKRMVMSGPLNRVWFGYEKIYSKLWAMELIEYTYLEDGTPDEIKLSDFGETVYKKMILES